MKWLERKKLDREVRVYPGETVRLDYFGRDGRHENITCLVERETAFDTLAIGELEDELGFSTGIVGVIGKEVVE